MVANIKILGNMLISQLIKGSKEKFVFLTSPCCLLSTDLSTYYIYI